MYPSNSNKTVLRNEINLYSYSWNESEQSITMNHKYTSCGADVNKWSFNRLQMILVLWAALSPREIKQVCTLPGGQRSPSRVLHYHLQENYFSNEESRPINPHGLTFLRLPSLAEQLVKIPFKKFIAQFCSNPSQQAQLWNFHLNWFMSWAEGGGAWVGDGWGVVKGEKKTSGNSLFLKGKA